MDYTDQIKAFYDLNETNAWATGQIALWHALMHISNKCNSSEWFAVSNQVLSIHTGLSRQGILKARNALKQDGIIEFKAKGTNATMYRMADLIAKSSQVDSIIAKSSQVGCQESSQAGCQESCQVDSIIAKSSQVVAKSSQESCQADPLINNKYIYSGDDDGDVYIYHRAREAANALLWKYWGRKATEADIESVRGKIIRIKENTLTVDETRLGLLKYAFECSVMANALNWNYIHGVMERLKWRGIKTLEQAYAFEVQRESL